MSLSSNEVLKCKLREGGVGAYPSSRPPSSTLHSTGAREEQSLHQQQPVQHIGRGRQSEWRIGNSRCGHSPSGFIQDPDPRPHSASLTPKSLWAHPWVEQPLVPAGRQRGDMANSPWRGRWKSLMLFFCRLVSILDGASGQIRYSIPEELKHGAFVGNIADDLGLNVAELSARRFRIVPSARRHYLEVNLENGILFVNEKIDREAVCGLNAACFLSLEVVIESPLELYQAEIEILDVNDNPPAFPSTQVKLDITESAAPGSRFPLESAQDPDVGTNSLRTYRLSPNEHFVLEVQTRSERSKIPELILERSLDRERQTVHRLLLTALDGGVPERSGSVRIAIHVVDANDNAPVFERPVYTVRVAENAPRGTLLIQLNASDLDEGTNGRIAYSLGSHAHGTVRELFSVDPHTGQVRVKGGLDYEGGPVHEVYVQAKDLGPNAVAAHCNVIVEVEDVNDNRPEIVLTSLSSPVPEDASPGTVIALISVTDRDTGANGRVSCRLTGSPPFKLLPSFRKYFTLVTERRLDRELVPEYNVTVAARDGGSPPLSSSRTIRVKVSDVNDNAPRFSRASYTVYVMENNAPGASICSVTAEDPDANQNSYLSYSILEGQVQGMPVSTYVSVNSDTGSLYALRSFDFEQLRKFRVQIRAQDAGFTPLSSNCTINILILDQNDNGPVIVAPLPRNGSVAAETVPRWAAAGHLAVRVTAVDADQGANARLSYRLLRATERGLFKLDVHTGEIRMARPFGPRDSPQQSLVLQAQDGGVPPLSATLTILLTAVDRVPEPRAEPDRDSQLNSDLTLYLIISLGSISFLFLLAILLLALARWHRHRLHADGCSPLACCPAARRRNTAHIFQKPDVNLQLAAGAQGAAIGSGEFPTCGEFPACRLPSQAYRYKVCLTPESAKSDFMFLRPCGPATPPNNNPLQGCHVRVAGGSGLSAATKAPTEVKQQNTDYPPFQRNVGFSSREPEETGIRNDGQTESGKVRSAVTTPTGTNGLAPSPGADDHGWTRRYGPQYPYPDQPTGYKRNIYIPGSIPVKTSKPNSPIDQDQNNTFSTFGKKNKLTSSSLDIERDRTLS